LSIPVITKGLVLVISFRIKRRKVLEDISIGIGVQSEPIEVRIKSSIKKRKCIVRYLH
jgi:hypothetical protein